MYAENHGAPPEYLNGTIIKKNLSNFQKEYVMLRDQEGGSLSQKELSEKAIKNISFGKERVKPGYDDISVDVVKKGDVDVDGKIESDVPTSVKITARKNDIDKA